MSIEMNWKQKLAVLSLILLLINLVGQSIFYFEAGRLSMPFFLLSLGVLVLTGLFSEALRWLMAYFEDKEEAS